MGKGSVTTVVKAVRRCWGGNACANVLFITLEVGRVVVCNAYEGKRKCIELSIAHAEWDLYCNADWTWGRAEMKLGYSKLLRAMWHGVDVMKIVQWCNVFERVWRNGQMMKISKALYVSEWCKCSTRLNDRGRLFAQSIHKTLYTVGRGLIDTECDGRKCGWVWRRLRRKVLCYVTNDWSWHKWKARRMSTTERSGDGGIENLKWQNMS